jgi:hypothetical protein
VNENEEMDATEFKDDGISETDEEFDTEHPEDSENIVEPDGVIEIWEWI